MEKNLPLQKNPVAIIGMSGLFAGSQNIDAFWENIVEQANCISEVPLSRWDISEYYDPDPNKPDKTYSKVGGFIPDIDFDPLEYGLPPNILEVTDSSQILSLVMTKQALQDARYDGDRFTEQVRRNTGVILGVGGGQKLMEPLSNRLQYPIWRKVLQQYGLSEAAIEEAVEKMKCAYVPWQENAFPGFLSNVIAGRIANRFDLGGTNCVVDAACAASLSAIKMSINELVEHRCDMMISGGVDTDNSPMAYMSFSKTPAFSKKNKIRPFDAEADGIVIGEGIGMVVMKRLADAERDGDTIYAVIRGIGSSSDGRHSSIYGPVSQGQQLAMHRAYEEAGYEPASVGLLEAHGTGTPTGDRVEFHSISSVFHDPKAPKQRIALGSVKSQIGHTKTAAGAASLIKASLALHHKVLPPTINISKPNPEFNIESTPFYLNTQLRPWIQPKGKHARRASVSAFGFGGTNFHLTLEEYQPEHQDPYRRWSPYHTAVLYADNHEALKQRCQIVLSDLQRSTDFEPLPVPRSIPQKAPRLGFVYQSKAELMDRLKTGLQLLQHSDPQKAFDNPQGISYSPDGNLKDSKIAVLFSGQGAQYVNMGSKLGCLYPEFRLNFQNADKIMQTMYHETLSDKVFPIPVFDDAAKQEQQLNLTQTQYAQPAIGVISMSLYKLLTRTGLQPDMVGGHSFGELTALWAAGVLKEQDYLKLACIRGQVMAQAAKGNDAGGMIAVQGDTDAVLKLIEEQHLNLDLSNINAPDQVVLGGATADVERAAEVFTAHKLYAKVLPVSAAFHTLRLRDAQQPLAEAIGKTPFQNPKLAVYSNIDGQAYAKEGTAIQQKYKEHMLSTVQFQQEIEAMYEAGARIFVEVGPRNILSNLVQSTLRNRTFKTIPLNSNPKQDSAQLYQQALMQLLVAGVSLNMEDPYQLAPQERKIAKPKMKIPFNASNYVSEKTKQQWLKAQQESPLKVVNQSKQENIQPMNPKETSGTTLNGHAMPADQNTVVAFTQSVEETNHLNLSLQMLEKQINLMGEMIQFSSQQQEALEKHRMFLEDYKHQMNQMFAEDHSNGKEADTSSRKAKVTMPDLSDLFTTIISNGNGQASSNGHSQNGYSHHGNSPNGNSPNGDSRNGDSRNGSSNGHSSNGNLTLNGHAVNGHTLYGDTSNADSRNDQTPAKAAAEVSTPQTKAPAPLVPARGAEKQEKEVNPLFEAAVLSLIADKTGYPAEMLNLEMELVADLGIDSIKQVEIFGAMREQYPVLHQWQTEDFVQVKTLGDIVEMVNQQLASADTDVDTSTPAKETSVAEPAENPASADLSMAEQITAVALKKTENTNRSAVTKAADPAVLEQSPKADAIAKSLMAVIADKTGYPAEMLNHDMELVADLGIDSIKQVEIFGAIREQYPAFQTLQPEQLLALKTISDVKGLLESSI
ncbi:type I polyketide synthase [Cesiribacter sp. SM1]|uniref:type I polyketide synthase n=1 Tax=Cesiribacter sp. SM1 TaxID=2861196 RepID=UPI001CD71158|nr:type I polyketide synthase [Cesiribacter sp. SM1]